MILLICEILYSYAVYLVIVILKFKEKDGNHNDWLEISRRDEKIRLEEFAEGMAQKGTPLGTTRIEGEKKIKEDFKYERKKKKREFNTNLIQTLFLK